MEILEILGIIGAIVGFTEWRIRSLQNLIKLKHDINHTCIARIEGNLNKHIDETKGILERFFRLEAKFT